MQGVEGGGDANDVWSLGILGLDGINGLENNDDDREVPSGNPNPALRRASWARITTCKTISSLTYRRTVSDDEEDLPE